MHEPKKKNLIPRKEKSTFYPQFPYLHNNPQKEPSVQLSTLNGKGKFQRSNYMNKGTEGEREIQKPYA